MGMEKKRFILKYLSYKKVLIHSYIEKWFVYMCRLSARVGNAQVYNYDTYCYKSSKHLGCVNTTIFVNC